MLLKLVAFDLRILGLVSAFRSEANPETTDRLILHPNRLPVNRGSH